MDLILCCGDRNWSDSQKILHRLASLGDCRILHGACRGADQLSGKAASMLGYEVLAMPADWQKYGKAAGPIRNRAMLSLCPDLVIAFHSNIASSKGTADTLREAKRLGIPTELVT